MKKEKQMMKTETMMLIMFIALAMLNLVVYSQALENNAVLMINNNIAKCEIQNFANDENTNSSKILFVCPFKINQTGEKT